MAFFQHTNILVGLSITLLYLSHNFAYQDCYAFVVWGVHHEMAHVAIMDCIHMYVAFSILTGLSIGL